MNNIQNNIQLYLLLKNNLQFIMEHIAICSIILKFIVIELYAFLAFYLLSDSDYTNRYVILTIKISKFIVFIILTLCIIKLFRTLI